MSLEILVVDDHAVFRESLTLALSRQPGFSVSYCGSASEALDIVAEKPVDVVLLDYDLGSENARRFPSTVREAGFGGRVLIVTGFVSDYEAKQLIHDGVAGIFLKEQPLGVLVEAIHAVAEGGAWLDQRFLRLLSGAQAHGQSERQPRKLSERERGVLGGLLEGLSNKEIAAQLGISEPAVKTTFQRLFEKMGVRTRGHLVRIVLERYRDQL